MKSASVKLLSTGLPVYHDLAEFNRLVEEIITVTGRLAYRSIPSMRTPPSPRGHDRRDSGFGE
jgi:hypothetical protein